MSNETNTENGPGSSKVWWIIIAGAAVVVIVVLAFIFFGNQGATPSEGTNPTPAPPEVVVPTPAPDVASVTANVEINVRSGPGTNYPAYGVAPTGSQAEVSGVSPDGGWWNISVKPENIPAGNAWVSAEYVTAQNTENGPVVQPPPPPPETAPPTPEPGEPTVTTTDVVNVRSGPGTNYSIYGLAPKGASGKVVGISEDSGWWAVELPTTTAPDGMGWVSAAYVTTANTDGVPVVTTPPLP